MTAIDAGEPSPEVNVLERAMDRAEIFRAAHRLVTDLDWGSYTVDVPDVARVAEFLAGEWA
ncbi:hypothetical protein OG709_29985 [Streptomyces sp. NBC_01267]|uniref:hypothetical protein n=1 Tax=Streptomyces sp. NBC_01267 TaxID=2903805 RepID=UPI002E306207|nr:hypothetical protein [Streptomyces sp. NBC_01267]